MELYQQTICELREKLDHKEITAKELAISVLKRIQETDPKLNAYISIFEDRALLEAENFDKGKTKKSFLAGIPFAAKDNFCLKDTLATGGSKILENYVCPYTSTVLASLGDSVLVGKSNLDEFAMGSSGENSAYGPTKNPYDLSRVPGGSSAGSAAAVAAGSAIFALGTDTGGSVRQPAGLCGVVGFKPTYGRISRYGVMAMASSLDTISFFTKDVTDAAHVLKELAGYDPHDQTTPQVEVEDYPALILKPNKKLRIGIPQEYFEAQGVQSAVKQALEKTISKYNELGAEIVKISLPHTEAALAAYYLIMSSEVSSNMSRYDGIKYGLSDQTGQDLLSVYLKSRSSNLGAEVKRRIMLGAFSLSHGYYDAYYKKAQKIRTLVCEDFTKAYDLVDVILTPVSPTTAFPLGEKLADPLEMYLADIFTIPASLAGLPAISFPVAAAKNLPIGVQLIGKQFAEATVLQAALLYEKSRSPLDLSLMV